MALLGTKDPRLTPSGFLDLRLQYLIRAFGKQDPPPQRTIPLPVAVIRNCVVTAYAGERTNQSLLAAADLIVIAFFFLMRPGEYCSSTSTDEVSHPFTLADLTFSSQGIPINHLEAPLDELTTASEVLLTFTRQKNANRGEKIGHACSGDPLFCPVQALIRRVKHLRMNGASPTCTIHTYYPQFRTRPTALPRAAILRLLRRSASEVASEIPTSEVHTRALRASGAMALISSSVDSNIIRLLGRWQSDAMLHYLHVQNQPILHQLATVMHQAT